MIGTIVLCVLVWYLFGLLGFCLCERIADGHWPYMSRLGFMVVFSIFGPFLLLLCMIISITHIIGRFETKYKYSQKTVFDFWKKEKPKATPGSEWK